MRVFYLFISLPVSVIEPVKLFDDNCIELHDNSVGVKHCSLFVQQISLQLLYTEFIIHSKSCSTIAHAEKRENKVTLQYLISECVHIFFRNFDFFRNCILIFTTPNIFHIQKSTEFSILQSKPYRHKGKINSHK